MTSSTFELGNTKNAAILRDFLIFDLDNVKNAAILRDFLNFRSWQHQKRSNSASLPLKMESWVQSWRPRTNPVCDLQTTSIWSTAPTTKKWGQAIRSAALVTQNHLRKPQGLMLENTTRLRNQRPDLPTSLKKMSLVLGPPREMHLCRSSANVPRLPTFLKLLQNPHVLLTFGKVPNPLRMPRKTTS